MKQCVLYALRITKASSAETGVGTFVRRAAPPPTSHFVLVRHGKKCNCKQAFFAHVGRANLRENGLSHLSSLRHKKTRQKAGFHGAEKRIRTSGRVTPVTRFPIVLLKPLRHLCKDISYFTTNARKKQLLLTRFRQKVARVPVFFWGTASPGAALPAHGRRFRGGDAGKTGAREGYILVSDEIFYKYVKIFFPILLPKRKKCAIL